jgi:hypothetical protein
MKKKKKRGGKGSPAHENFRSGSSEYADGVKYSTCSVTVNLM